MTDAGENYSNTMKPAINLLHEHQFQSN